LQKLQPFIGIATTESSYFAATYDVYFPFLTSEVKCGASALDVADRQNANSQTVALRGLFELFRLVGRERELHEQVNGFSVSHSDENVRIWGHFVVLDGTNFSCYRVPIAKFDISRTMLSDNRWLAYTFIRNVYDLWLPAHFEKICSAIDMLPSDLNFEVIDQPEAQAPSSDSGSWQQVRDQEQSSRNERAAAADGNASALPTTQNSPAQPGSSALPITPDSSARPSSTSKKNRTN
jgi:hypothetical protein